MWSDGLAGRSSPESRLSPDIRHFEMPVFEAVFFEQAPLSAQAVAPAEEAQEQHPGDGGPEDAKALEITSRIEELEREAFEKGYESGEEAGYAMGQEKARVLVERMEAVIEELSSLKDRTVKELEPQFVELAMSAARQIVIEELTVNRDAVARITKEALSKMLPQQRITIRTNPFVCEVISKHNPGLLQGGGGNIVIEADPNAGPHGAVIAGQLQEIETGLDEQLSNMIKQMAARLGQTAVKNREKSDER